MSHAIALWPGRQPTDADAACTEYSRRMITHGVAWQQERTVPDPDPRAVAFFRDAAALISAVAETPASPWGDPEGPGTIWGDVLTLDLDGPQPRTLALLALLADHHGLVLFDLHAHRVLTPEDISATFGKAMIPVPASLPIQERLRRCLALYLCSEELGVILPDPFDCSRPLDPTSVVVIQDELNRFRRVLEELGFADLEDLRWRLEELIAAGGEQAL